MTLQWSAVDRTRATRCVGTRRTTTRATGRGGRTAAGTRGAGAGWRTGRTTGRRGRRPRAGSSTPMMASGGPSPSAARRRRRSTKQSPANGTTGLGSAVTLTWGAASGATNYQVCYDTTNDGACAGSWVSAGTATSSALSSLAAGTYYWQVRAQNATGTTDADGGTWWAFTVAGSTPPAAFAKTSPANGATNLGSAPALSWGASTGATGYAVCVDPTNDGACGTAWQSAARRRPSRRAAWRTGCTTGRRGRRTRAAPPPRTTARGGRSGLARRRRRSPSRRRRTARQGSAAR